MALQKLGKVVLSSALKKNGICVAPFVRTYWNKDWKPGPYPKTPEERAAAAKKYNLITEDYEPYPDDGEGYGDYPMLPEISADSRDEFQNYSFPEYRRDFGETMHVESDMLGEDRYNANARHLTSPRRKLIEFFAIILSMAGMFYLTEHFDIRLQHRRMPKEFPADGKPHYSFEPVD